MPCGALYDITSIHASYIIKIFIIFKILYNDCCMIMVIARVQRHCEQLLLHGYQIVIAKSEATWQSYETITNS